MSELSMIIEGLVRAVREGDDAAQKAAAQALCAFAWPSHAHKVLIAEAGAVPPLVQLLRAGSAAAKREAAATLGALARNDDNLVLIAEAGGIPPLVDLLRNSNPAANWLAADALNHFARNNDANSSANAVAIAAAVGLEALVELARRGRVTVAGRWYVSDVGIAVKRKAALVVAALLRACVPVEARSRADVQDIIRGLIGPYL